MKKTIWLISVAVLSLGLAIAACDSGSSGGDECTTVCDGKECGTIGDCICGSCGDDEACNDENMCEVISAECLTACTDKVCGTFDDCDCGACGDGEVCNADGTACEEISAECEVACDGKDCGTFDGCECGACEDGFECDDDGACQEICEPVCAADGVPFECGDSGCPGETCGDCPGGAQWSCEEHMCVCTPACDDKVCGADGCGDECGTCEDDWTCWQGACVEGCNFEFVAEEWADPILKVNQLMIDGDGMEGHGLDVDQDPDTCAPEGNCEAGIDNALGGILGQIEQYVNVGEELENALVDGSVVLLIEAVDYVSDGTEFPVYFYLGEVTGTIEECDYQAAKCNYLVDPQSYDPAECVPLISFDNATVTDGFFVAGGPDAIFSMTIDAQGIPLTITAVQARIEADITEAEGAPVALDNGIIGGAVPKALIMEAVDNLPDDIELPVSPELIKGMLDMFIIPDIDAGDDYGMGDPDGIKESASVGIQIGAIEGAVTGFKAEE